MPGLSETLHFAPGEGDEGRALWPGIFSCAMWDLVP